MALTAFKLPVSLRMTLNFLSSWLHLPTASIAGMYCHSCLVHVVLRTEPRVSVMPEEYSPSGACAALFLGGFDLLHFSRNGLSQTYTSCSVTFKIRLWCQTRWCRLPSHLLEHVRWEDQVLKLRNLGLMWPTWKDHLSQVIVHDTKKIHKNIWSKSCRL